MNKGKIVAIIMCVMSVLVLSIGLTYAYFNNLIEGSGSKFTVTTGELKLIYTDTMAIGEGSISPGYSVTKTFTVENTTDSEVYYKLAWENLVNTFVNTSDLTVTISSTNNGGTLSKTSIPSSSIESNVDIIEEIAIGGNTIQEYTLTIEYAEAEYDQSADMGKKLSGTIEIHVIESISRTVIVRSNNESYGTVSPGEIEVENKGSATFTLNANEGYQYISNTCNGSVEGNILTIENIESDITCEVEFGIKEYTVTASVNDNTYASIDSPTSVVVNHGESTTFNYNVNEGYEYESVEGCTGEYDTGTNILTVSNVTENTSCKVNFKIKEYNVSISGINGTVTPEVAVVEHGGSTTFEASTEEAYDISSGNLVCNNGASGSINGNTITVNNITNDTVCTITFSKKQYTITASSTNTNYGTVDPTTNTVDYGENATITLTPATGYEYSSNTCGAAYSNNTLTLTNVTSNKTCEVTFSIKTYNVSVTSNNTSYGTITQSASTVNHGGNVTVTLSPKTGYQYSSNTCGGTVNGSTLTISNITEAKTCQVTFAIKTYGVNVTSTNTSYGTVNPTTTTINHGSNATITLSPKTGYQYSSNTCGGTVSGNTMTISNITSAKTCTVTFSPITYSITYNLNNGTQGSNAVTSYNVTTSTFSLPTPTRTGYTFNGWYTTSNFSGSAVTQITKGSTGNKTYYAKWTLNTYNVNVTSTNNSYGTVSPTSQVVNHGSSATITLSPATGYKYSSNTCGGTVSGNTMTISNVTAAKTCTVTFEQVSYVAGCNEGTLCAQIANDNPNVSTRKDFSGAFTDSNNGNTIYKASGQDNKDTYYFAGAVTNNYVKFGTDASGNDLWWRIVRINEDNSVRLIYAGTSATDTAGNIGSSYFNYTAPSASFEGYKYTDGVQYGTSMNSTIKTTVDTWYTSNLADEASYLSQTAIYCNDRSMQSGVVWVATAASFGTGIGSTRYHASFERLYTNKMPTFICTNSADKFTVSSTTGNGALENPMALITADEAVYAGGSLLDTNTGYYLIQNATTFHWWTMTPPYWSGANYGNELKSEPYIYRVNYTGQIYASVVNGTRDYIRPVTSLKSCVKWSGGNGTSGNPYTVSIDSTCASAIN